jgi:hypothetical protein
LNEPAEELLMSETDLDSDAGLGGLIKFVRYQVVEQPVQMQYGGFQQDFGDRLCWPPASYRWKACLGFRKIK